MQVSEDALAMIARAADGSMRDALSLTDQVISIGEGPVTAERVREALGLVPEDEFIAILDIIAGHRAGDVFGAVNKLADAGVDFGVFLSGFADMLRAQLTVVLNGKAEGVSAAAAASTAAVRPTRRASPLTIVRASRYSDSWRRSRLSVTSAADRMTETGVRSSCDASAVKRRSCSNASRATTAAHRGSLIVPAASCACLADRVMCPPRSGATSRGTV